MFSVQVRVFPDTGNFICGYRVEIYNQMKIQNVNFKNNFRCQLIKIASMSIELEKKLGSKLKKSKIKQRTRIAL